MATNIGEPKSLVSKVLKLLAKEKAVIISRVVDRNAESKSTDLPGPPYSTNFSHSLSN